MYSLTFECCSNCRATCFCFSAESTRSHHFYVRRSVSPIAGHAFRIPSLERRTGPWHDAPADCDRRGAGPCLAGSPVPP